MASMVKPAQTSNRLLESLQPADFALLKPHLKRADLPLRKRLEIRDRPVETAYFLETGLASMVASGGADQNVEVGIIGCEGMTGLPLLLNDSQTPHDTFMQIAGSGWSLPASALTGAIENSSALRHLLLRYVYTFLTQMSSAALANARYKIDERLARWILMAHDRVQGPEINLTHEFFALMLGTRRAGVTAAIVALQRAGAIEGQRGKVIVRSRAILEDIANGCYGAPEKHYTRLIPAAA